MLHLLKARPSHTCAGVQARPGQVLKCCRRKGRVCDSAPAATRMPAPAFGPRSDDESAVDVLESILGAAAGETDPGELACVAALQRQLHFSKCREACDLMEVGEMEWRIHLQAAGWAAAMVPGTVRHIFKYLGVRGVPHKPAGAIGVTCECLALHLSTRMLPLCLVREV
jgi:hypothetical protein